MPPKKGFEAFLKKNQKKGGKAAKTEQNNEAAEAEQKAQEQAKQEEVKNTPAAKHDADSDEEVDELELAAQQ